MGYACLRECLADLEAQGQLKRVDAELDPYLDLAAVQRRAFRAKAPALLFSRVRGTRFPMLANLFGTRERLRYIFRDSLAAVDAVLAAKADPATTLRRPWRSLRALPGLFHMLPRVVRSGRAPVLECRCKLADLPRLTCWPQDGGPFITLPLVYTEDPRKPGLDASNLGMYRVQLAGNAYAADEAGLHYQIHRGMGAHHAAALASGRPLPVHIYVGGPPALSVAAVMPLPEGLSELRFAGLLGGRRTTVVRDPMLPLPVLAQADFCLSGHLLPGLKPRGRSAIIWGITVCAMIFRCSKWKPCITARTRSGLSPQWAAPRRKTLFSASSSMSLPRRWCPRCLRAYRRYMPWTRPECTPCFWPWAASGIPRMKRSGGRANCSPRPCICWARHRPPWPNM